MISCHGLTYQQPPTIRMLKTIPAEHPFAVQLFGAEPAVMAEAAAILNDYPLDIVDINMGCPVRKVVRKGAGAALMRNPKLAAEIIKQVVANSKRPVTVKFRSGWNHDEITAPEFARLAEANGASAVTVHARTWSDGFSGRADWRIIAMVVQAVRIPVIGNGDIKSSADVHAMLDGTGCQAVMIGRAALGAPWIFQKNEFIPTLNSRRRALARHLELIALHMNPNQCLGRIKNHAGRYFKGQAGGSAIRQKIYASQTFNDLKAVISV